MKLWTELQRLESRLNLALAWASGLFANLTAQQSGAYNYFLDPGNSTGAASDNNSGTSAAKPFLTTGPLAALLNFSNLTGTCTVNVMSSFPAAAPTWTINATVGKGGLLWIKGTQLVQHAGTFTSQVPAGAALATATDPGGFSFTPYVGTALVKITSNADAGATAPIRAAPSSGVCTMGSLGVALPSTIDIGPISPLIVPCTYSVVQPVKLPQVAWNVNGVYQGLSAGNQGGFNCTDCWFVDDPNNASAISGTAFVQFANCLVGTGGFYSPAGAHVNCLFTSGSQQFFGAAASWQLVGGCAYGATLNVESGVLSSDDFGLDGGGIMAVQSTATYFALTIDAFNCATPFTVVGTMRYVGSGHQFWGQNNTVTTISIYAGGTLALTPAGDTITITNSGTSDVLLDGLSSTSYVRTDTGAFVAGPTLLSWTNIKAANSAAGFGYSVTSTISGARIIQSTSE